MTEATGNPSPSKESSTADLLSQSLGQATDTLRNPWERAWNEGVKAVKSLIAPTEPPKASTGPWDQNWGGSKGGARTTQPEPVKPADFQTMLSSFTPKLEKMESSGNPDAANPKSSALGLHQFTAGTWKDTVKAMGVSYPLSDRTNPERSREVFNFFTEKNAIRAQKDLGRTPQEHELYAYHLLGRAGGGDLLSASPNASAAEVVGERNAKKNAGLFYQDPKTKEQPRTVAEVLEVFKGKFK